ncbi:hypothetical protein [Myroides injenensis]|uniref:hypothetical protein n=1 Tax=Myroides injenensis TaxID=1183151 RepID=UPI00028827E8|nr:hypothetical protein [Myroides injenensis]
MEWNKIEKQWKHRLDKREIAPSNEMWVKLSSQLDQQQISRKKSFLKYWIAIAASLLVVASFFLNYDKSIEYEEGLPAIDSLDAKSKPQDHKVVDTEKRDLIEEKKDSEVKEANAVTKKQMNIITAKNVGVVEVTHEIKEDTIENIAKETLETPVIQKSNRRIVVNSDDLLNQVEKEIEVEYRESVIKKIYDKTKKVIVER